MEEKTIKQEHHDKYLIKIKKILSDALLNFAGEYECDIAQVQLLISIETETPVFKLMINDVIVKDEEDKDVKLTYLQVLNKKVDFLGAVEYFSKEFLEPGLVKSIKILLKEHNIEQDMLTINISAYEGNIQTDNKGEKYVDLTIILYNGPDAVKQLTTGFFINEMI